MTYGNALHTIFFLIILAAALTSYIWLGMPHGKKHLRRCRLPLFLRIEVEEAKAIC